jgi:hypothetical protein
MEKLKFQTLDKFESLKLDAFESFQEMKNY